MIHNLGSTTPPPMATSLPTVFGLGDIWSIGPIEVKRGIDDDIPLVFECWAAGIAAWISFARIVCSIWGCESRTLPNGGLSCSSFRCSILGR